MADNEKKELETVEEPKPVKQEKAKKKDKPSVFSRIAAWFRSCKSEIKKIVWASPKSVLNNFVLVAVTVVVMSAAIAVLDYLFGQAINALTLLF